MLRLFLLTAGFIILQSDAFAQNKNQLIEYAESFEKAGDYYGASIWYQKALEKDSTDLELINNYAHSLKNQNDYKKALWYFQKITGKDAGGRIIRDAYFWQGEMQKFLGDYKSASNSFKKAKSLYSRDKNSYIYLKSKQEYLSCSFAKRTQNNLEDCKIENFDSINTYGAEFGGVYKDSLFYFTRLKSSEPTDDYIIPDNTVYLAKILSDNQVIELSNKHVSHLTFNYDHSICYFSVCDSVNQCKIFSAVVDNKINLTKVQELPEKINFTNCTHPSYAKIGKEEYLFFSAGKASDDNKMDLYYALILDGNTYGKPQSLADQINSLDNEITPYYDTLDKALYFSSTWHPGYGGYDVFKSSGDPKIGFSKPQNVGKPINSSYNDMYYRKSNTYDALVTSNRVGTHSEKNATCCNDIWKVEFPKPPSEETEIVIENLDDLNKYLPVTLYFHNDRPGPRSLDTVVSDNYLLTYEKYKALQPTYRAEYSKGLDGEKELQAELDIDDYFKNYVNKGVKDLELFSKLLLDELNKGQKIEVTVRGFASPLAKTDYNVNLTKRRISTLINYLYEYGDGEFIPYIQKSAKNGGALNFIKIPFGEYTAGSNVSDDYYDQRNSIYNRKAALERKIEIQSVTFIEKDSIYAELTVPNGTIDFGKVEQGEKLSHSFVIENTGNKPLKIISLVNGSKSVKSEASSTVIPASEEGEVVVTIDTKDLVGKSVQFVSVIADSFPKTKRLLITFEIAD